MLMFIIGMSLLYSYVMSYLHIFAERGRVDRRTRPVEMDAARRDPAAGHGARLLPAAGVDHPDDRARSSRHEGRRFDLIWFGVVMTIVMGDGADPPPVGLNIFVIKNIAPDILLPKDVVWGVIPLSA